MCAHRSALVSPEMVLLRPVIYDARRKPLRAAGFVRPSRTECLQGRPTGWRLVYSSYVYMKWGRCRTVRSTPTDGGQHRGYGSTVSIKTARPHAMPSSQLIQCCVGRGVDVGSRDDADDDQDATTRLVQRYCCQWTIAIYDSDPKIMINISHCHRCSPPWRSLPFPASIRSLFLSPVLYICQCAIGLLVWRAWATSYATFLTLSVHLTSSVSVCPEHSVRSPGYCFHLRRCVSCLSSAQALSFPD